MISGGRPDSVGGGVVADIFRDRRKPGTFSGGGGGGSTRIFLTSPITISQPDSVGGGENCLAYFLTGAQDKSNYLNSGHFFGHFRVTSRLPEINCRKKTFNKSLGGPWPPWPPPWLRHWSICRENMF